MKKVFVLSSLLVAASMIFGPQVWAQKDSSDTFTLEEITVTAEKRAENLQSLPSSVVALPGTTLTTQGLISTKEILDTIPNVTFMDGSGNTEGNIAVRGVQRMQVPAGGPGLEAVLPSSTAVYVDGIYQGIGGEYDLQRVEVLRGPQGTLYGRSATGGVISFYTNDPKMGTYEGNFSAEVGTNALVNTTGVLNVPVGEKVALRAAVRYYSREDFFAEGSATGSQQITEGRLKARFQPTDPLDIVLEAETKRVDTWSGGWSQVLTDANDINYKQTGSYNAPLPRTEPEKYNQLGMNTNYDFGNMTLTWIAGYHNYENNAWNAETVRTDQAGNVVGGAGGSIYPTDWTHTEEVRLTSDKDSSGFFTWIVGANYFENKFENLLHNTTSAVYTVSAEDYAAGVRVGQPSIDAVVIDSAGTSKNYGIFTEETFNITDDFRITAGLRYDKTKLDSTLIFKEGLYSSPNHIPYLVDGEYAYSVIDAENVPSDWSNITYKLRLEYDLTPDNMVYFTTATGFLPGFAGVSPDPKAGTWNFVVVDEQKLTSYEIGSKNQLMNNRLRLNGSVFYYDIDGYTDTFSLNDTGGGPPGWSPVTLKKVRIYGLDMDSEFLLTANDKLTFTLGYLSTKITPPDTLTWKSGTTTPGSYLLMIDQQTGHPTWKGSLAYDHTFTLSDGATLVPRLELFYTGAYYVGNYTHSQLVQLGDPTSYLHQDSYPLVNANLMWTSASQKYSVNAWVRNALSEEYKASVSLPQNPPLSGFTGVTPGDPRTFGMMLNVKF